MKKYFFAFVYSCSMFAACNSPAQMKDRALLEDLSLKYIVQQPRVADKVKPVIILLHGVGSNEKDLMGLAGSLPDDALIISARAPITLSDNSFAWYHINFANGTPAINNGEAEESRATISRFIGEVKKKYNTGSAPVFLMGFSQGSIMSYSIGLSHPESVKGILILSGRILDEAKTMLAKPELLKKLAIFIGHGTNDKVLPVTYGRTAKEYLIGLKLKPTYHEYAMAHEINNDELSDIRAWFKAQLK